MSVVRYNDKLFIVFKAARGEAGIDVVMIDRHALGHQRGYTIRVPTRYSNTMPEKRRRLSSAREAQLVQW